jgi:hypothetical protein
MGATTRVRISSDYRARGSSPVIDWRAPADRARPGRANARTWTPGNGAATEFWRPAAHV